MKDVYNFFDLQNWRDSTASEPLPLRLAVFGDPIAHSKSPSMHNAALEKCGIAARYTRLHIHAGELAQALRLLPRQNFAGANLTIPHKAAALPLMGNVDEHARRIGAINTVVVEGEKLTGFNTDGPGFARAIRDDFGVELRDLRVLLLGAGGGAGRAIAVQCALEKCEHLVLANRTLEKAQALADELSRGFASIEAIPLQLDALTRRMHAVDLVINATALGMQPSDPSPIPRESLRPQLLVYDTIYTAHRTPLLRAADEAGARGANGLSMLLHQGALAFEIWFHRPAPVEAMRAALL